MSNAVILTEITGGIGTVTLNKPWKLNAWDTPMRAEITARAQRLESRSRRARP